VFYCRKNDNVVQLIKVIFTLITIIFYQFWVLYSNLLLKALYNS